MPIAKIISGPKEYQDNDVIAGADLYRLLKTGGTARPAINVDVGL